MENKTAAQVKKLIVEGNSEKTFYLAEHDGSTWATNRYWLAPVARVMSLLDKFNITADAVGGFEVNGSVRKRSDEAPNVGRLLDLDSHDRELTRAKVGTLDAYAKNHLGQYLAVFTDPDGEHVCARADYLEWLSDVEGSVSYGERFSNVRYRQKGHANIAIVADREVKHGGHRDPNSEEYKWIPETWENKGPAIVAIVMPYRIS